MIFLYIAWILYIIIGGIQIWYNITHNPKKCKHCRLNRINKLKQNKVWRQNS